MLGKCVEETQRAVLEIWLIIYNGLRLVSSHGKRLCHHHPCLELVLHGDLAHSSADPSGELTDTFLQLCGSLTTLT